MTAVLPSFPPLHDGVTLSHNSTSSNNNTKPRLHANNTNHNTRPLPYPLPKKLGSDRLLLVSNALHDIPTYKSISPILTKQKLCLKKQLSFAKATKTTSPSATTRNRRVRFRSVPRIHEFEKYDKQDHPRLFFQRPEFFHISDRDDEEFATCFQSMAYTKQILQLWGLCSRKTYDKDTNDTILDAVQQLRCNDPLPAARGLEHRIVTGIRNHRQEAVRSFLEYSQRQRQHNSESSSIVEDEEEPSVVCPRYLKFSQTASRFAQALAQGDAFVVHELLGNEDYDDDDDENHDSELGDYDNVYY